MSQWNPRKENTCHPAVITLLPLPMVNPEETLRIQDYRPLGSCAVLSLVIQSCPTLCDPMNCSLLGSSVCGILQARILEWVSVPFSRGSSQPRDRTQVSCIAGRFFTSWATREAQKKEKLLSRVQYFVTPWTEAYQAPPSMEFSRLEYWSGLPFPSPEDLPDSGIEPRSPSLQQMLYHLSHQVSPLKKGRTPNFSPLRNEMLMYKCN